MYARRGLWVYVLFHQVVQAAVGFGEGGVAEAAEGGEFVNPLLEYGEGVEGVAVVEGAVVTVGFAEESDYDVGAGYAVVAACKAVGQLKPDFPDIFS